MKSFKRGRGPSFLGGFMLLLMGGFGVGWMAFASSIGGGTFSLFGLPFIIICLIGSIVNFRNAAGKNRYSEFDIVDDTEEPDPANSFFGQSNRNCNSGKDPWEQKDRDQSAYGHRHAATSGYCPRCGSAITSDFVYCPRCGNRLK
jgi:predicted lipid-binding transport protein (Tim44 family)